MRLVLKPGPPQPIVRWVLRSTDVKLTTVTEATVLLSAPGQLYFSCPADTRPEATARLGPCESLEDAHVIADLFWQGQTLR